MAKLHMDGPLRTWHETAYAATWVEGPVRQPVMVFLGPEGGAIPGPEAQQWVGMDAPGLLPLQRIVPIRRRWATVYPRPQALFFGAQGGHFVPLRLLGALGLDRGESASRGASRESELHLVEITSMGYRSATRWPGWV